MKLGTTMSGAKHILTFTLRNERFAVDAEAVKEIVWLPELTLVEEMPDYVAGVFNLRGHIVPVMDLNLCFGHEQERYRITDRVIVIRQRPPSPSQHQLPSYPLFTKEGEFGIIVNDVHDVISISESDIEQLPAIGPQPSAHFVSGEAKVGGDIVMLLEHDNLSPSIGGAAVSAVLTGGTPVPPKLTPEEQAVFHSRAVGLMQQAESLTLAGLMPHAVVGLNGEYYGIDLETVREFSTVGSITPVPCTPAHIVGNMNLRGDILTLLDIRGMLSLPTQQSKGEGAGKVIVSHINELFAGVTVDDVFEVIYLSPSDIRPVPSAVKASNDYISGEAPYAGKMLSILDLKKILTMEELVVDGKK